MKTSTDGSGTEEEYDEKDRLLQEISDLRKEYHKSNDSMSSQREMGIAIRNDALKSCSEDVFWIQQDGILIDEVFVGDFQQKNVETDNIRSEDSNSVSTTSEVSVPTRTRKRQYKCSNPTLQFLREKTVADREFKERKLCIEEKRLKIEERKIALQESKFQLQKEETMNRIECEAKERELLN